MKIAVCMSGFLRTFRQTIDSLSTNLILPNNCDVYVSTWDIWGNQHYKPDHYVTARCKEEKIPHKIKDIIPNLKCFYVEPFFEKTFEIWSNLSSNIPKKHYTANAFEIVQRLASMHYKIHSCNLLRKQQDYDVVVRCRPDMLVKKPIKIKDIEDSIYVPKIECYSYTNDQFAYGKSNLMDVYTNLHNEFLNYPKIQNKAEYLLQTHLSKYKINVKKVQIYYDLIRGCVDRLGYPNNSMKPSRNNSILLL